MNRTSASGTWVRHFRKLPLCPRSLSRADTALAHNTGKNLYIHVHINSYPLRTVGRTSLRRTGILIKWFFKCTPKGRHMTRM